MNQCVVFTANRGYALKSSREGLIRHFLEQGWTVVMATADDVYSQALVKLGAELEPVVFSRGGLEPLMDWLAWRRLNAIVKRHKPSLIHNFHAKPVILGSLAAVRQLSNRVRIINTITGLGHAFVRGGCISRLAGLGYARSLQHAEMTIFQNRDDLALFLAHGWVQEHTSSLIIGSGVNVERFIPQRNNGNERLVVLMLGRMIWQKGVAEFALAAQRVRKFYPDVRFLWAGEMDHDHPDAVPVDWVEKQCDFEYLGRVTDVLALFEQANVLLFPSYREGVPRTVMEAAACAIPTVGFDVPGVREAVRDGETGFLVEGGDVDALSEALLRLLENPDLRRQMGMAGRRMAEAEFDIRAIEAKHFDTYRELGVDIAAKAT